MATPHVTGGAALIIAQQGKMSPAKVRERLVLSAQAGPVPGDPDAYPEPILNVASLGPGSIDAPSSARPGEQIKIRVGGVIPRTTTTFRLNGIAIGTAQVTTKGNAYLTYRIPDMPYGKYEISATNNRKILTDRILIRPLLTMSDRSATVGETVSVNMRGFGAGESILLTMDTGAGSRSLVRVRASKAGVASPSFVVPSSTAGTHKVSAIDDSGHSASISLTVNPSMSVATSVEAGGWTPVLLSGFESAEVVDLRWGSATGDILRTKVVTATGSGSVNVQIPADATNGKHSLWAIGNGGNQVRVTVNTFGESADVTATQVPTRALSATAIPPTSTQVNTTATLEPATPTETPTVAQSSTAEPTSTAPIPPATETVELQSATVSPELPEETATS